MRTSYAIASLLLLQGASALAAAQPAASQDWTVAMGDRRAAAQEKAEGDGTRVDDRVERRQDRRENAAENYDGPMPEGDGTRVDDRVERRENAAENYDGPMPEGDGTRVDDRVDRRQDRRDAIEN